ncbi:HlyD family efflux transporter periplasmic adaptor subunit [Rhizobium sp. KVB221]|uniref:HlyD family efflux transporter periplasmic adaptor subunit n=1 Tax=Rhizobium setariae TaxID=2801340 RepID=A0A936YPG4_9HYPH|nr:HlyD family efflux transporter periplasmic adaptor subunit [Rhizobium setariae]MBL0372026.1 HlyD family efflux transporter periplasmic adaptor subunit [Rhizobium setariae]
MEFLCSLPLIASLFGACAPPPPLATGYVEGEYVLITPVETGRIVSLTKKRGDRVVKGDLIVQMEASDADIAVQEAQAALEQARAQLANLREGRRPEEIAVIEASMLSAKAQAAEARRVFDRESLLAERGVSTKANLDQASTAMQLADALVSQTSSNLDVARLPARPMEITAAEAQVKQAEAKLADAHWRLDHRQLRVPDNGVVDDIVRREGEVAGPSQPVVSYLPDGAVKLRLYAAERYMSGLKLGAEIAVRCDGCRKGLTARISYVSDSPEFTPPVIYSLENRQKLVYLIEARPDTAESELNPGQIVDVVLPETAR